VALQQVSEASGGTVEKAGEAAYLLRQAGEPLLARRLGRLAKARHCLAHPDVGFFGQLHAALGRREVRERLHAALERPNSGRAASSEEEAGCAGTMSEPDAVARGGIHVERKCDQDSEENGLATEGSAAAFGEIPPFPDFVGSHLPAASAVVRGASLAGAATGILVKAFRWPPGRRCRGRQEEAEAPQQGTVAPRVGAEAPQEEAAAPQEEAETPQAEDSNFADVEYERLRAAWHAASNARRKKLARSFCLPCKASLGQVLATARDDQVPRAHVLFFIITGNTP